MTASPNDDDRTEQSDDRVIGYPYSNPETNDDPDHGQVYVEGEHRPLTLEHPRASRRGDRSQPYRDLAEDFSPSEDEYPPEDDIWPEQVETSGKARDSGTDWSSFVRYFCRHCAEECINRLDEDRTWTKECRDCYRDDDLGDHVTLTRHLPDEHVDDQATDEDVRQAVEEHETD